MEYDYADTPTCYANMAENYGYRCSEECRYTTMCTLIAIAEWACNDMFGGE